ARIVGNIVHECAKKLADLIIDGQNVNKFSQNDVIEKVFEEKKYNYLKFMPNGEAKILNLKNEILKFFDFVLLQQQSSDFKISKAEFGFLENFDGIIFKGFVDRVDECGDEFVIVDYKTGSTKIDYSDIVLGKKVQLLLYAKILETKLHKKCVGVYYLTVNDDYSTQNRQKIYFNGITVNENNNMKKLSKTDGFFEFKDKFLLTTKQFDKLKNYVFQKVIDAIKQIKDAKFFENPVSFDDFCECDYCDYCEICCEKEKNYFEFDDEMIKEILDD
ncbi:MAG: PD-(D/E)XK nuclease family protein, partial [Christensenellales bacterium]